MLRAALRAFLTDTVHTVGSLCPRIGGHPLFLQARWTEIFPPPEQQLNRGASVRSTPQSKHRTGVRIGKARLRLTRDAQPGGLPGGFPAAQRGAPAHHTGSVLPEIRPQAGSALRDPTGRTINTIELHRTEIKVATQTVSLIKSSKRI